MADFDINEAFLTYHAGMSKDDVGSILGIFAPHSSIVEGGDDDSNITSLMDLMDTKPEGDMMYSGEKDVDSQWQEPPPDEAMDMEDEIMNNEMTALVYSEIMKKSIAGHHIDSMNHFYSHGIKQIGTKVFVVEGRIKNLRDKTPEDNEIADIAFRVDFTDINLTSPQTTRYKSGMPEMLTANMARLNQLNYSLSMAMDCTITATATLKNGGPIRTITDKVQDYHIANLPCMTGTNMCHTHNATIEGLKELEEDPSSPGGNFILRGVEWVVDNLENIANNSFHVYRNMHQNEISRGTFLSKPGDAFENSYQVVMRYLNSGAITVEITVSKKDKFEIPYYILFRAVGITSDRDILNHVVYGVDNDDEVTKRLMDILVKAFTVPSDKFDEIREAREPTKIVDYIASKISEVANLTNAKKDENVVKYLNTGILNLIDRYIFPHIGTDASHRQNKMRFLGHLVNKLLSVSIGIIDSTDRDSYSNKRIASAGISLAKAFKTQFNFAIVQAIKRRLIKEFKSTPFSLVRLGEAVKAAIIPDDLDALLTRSITTGNKTITVKRTEIINRVSSQTLYHKNDLNVKSTLGTINMPNSNASKQNERADEMRRVHASGTGMVDPSQSADTGEKVGMSKQMACTSSICGASSSFLLKKKLLNDSQIIENALVPPERITSDRLSKVFVNGDWIACCKSSYDIARKYRNARRHNFIHYQTSIYWHPLTGELYFCADMGRISRPLVIVYNNIAEYDDNWCNGDRTVVFKQWTKLTMAHITALRAGQITTDDLRNERIIEWIAADEQENMFLAENMESLRARKNDITRQYTHVDIDIALFGIVTLAAPMANHSNAVRNTLYTNHRKQSTSWCMLNFPFRIDRNVTFQHYGERPLVSTFSDALTHPNGHNTIVALAIHGGQNTEDSIKANQSSIDCGLFNASFYTYERAELDGDESFGAVDINRTLDVKKNAIYEYIKDGVIMEGTCVLRDYVLIVKTAKMSKPIDNYMFVDKSVVYKHDEPVYVERVIITRDGEDKEFAKVKLRADRPVEPGDKFSSRTGNKGICSLSVPRCDMPYSEDGLVPDLVVNVHSIPTRMAVNQVIEMLIGHLAASKGIHIDATSFFKRSVDDVLAECLRLGIGDGYRRMYDGLTGLWLDYMIFIGPTCYQRLQKFIRDENYAIKTGPTSAMTKQPLDGRNNGGGLRIGEMEKDVYAAHGTMRALWEKFYAHSDGLKIPFCRICGNRAVVNEKLNIYKCKHCGDGADICNVESSWVANVFMNEASAMNIKMTAVLQPYTFSRLATAEESQ